MTTEDAASKIADRLGVDRQALIDAVLDVADGRLNVSLETHGMDARFKAGCRCAVCVEGERARRRRRRDRLRDQVLETDADRRKVSHGEHRYSIYGCRCEVCVTAHIESTRASREAAQQKALETATRRGYHWTGPELELAARTDLSVRQIAAMLGRTYYSVGAMRHKLKHDPKTINRAGLSS